MLAWTAVTVKSLFGHTVLGIASAPIVYLINKYVFSDWEYIRFLSVIASVDTILGIYKAVLFRQLSPKGFGLVLKKFLIYSSVIVMAHVLVSFTIGGETQIVFIWVPRVVFSAIISREALSILRNISIISPDAMPAKLMKYFKDFDSFTGKPLSNITDAFKKSTNENN